jgi:hypothetical protein
MQAAEQRRAAGDAVAGGGERRRDSPVSSYSGSGAWFDARKASMGSARVGEATGGGGNGGDAAERTDDAAARLGTPATAPRRRGARGCHQAARKACSPPCASLGELLDDEAAPAAETESGGG